MLDEATPQSYNPQLNLDDALRHSFGIFATSGKPRKVVVKIAPRRVADVIARRWPAEAKTEETRDGWLKITFQVTDPREVVPWVLSFGGDPQIVEPPEAAEMARRFAETILNDHTWAENVPADERLMRFEWFDESA